MATYAVVKTGGKQYRVQPGDTIRVESLPHGVGDRVELSDILMVSRDGEVSLGTPNVSGCNGHSRGRGPGQGKEDHRIQVQA